MVFTTKATRRRVPNWLQLHKDEPLQFALVSRRQFLAHMKQYCGTDKAQCMPVLSTLQQTKERKRTNNILDEAGCRCSLTYSELTSSNNCTNSRAGIAVVESVVVTTMPCLLFAPHLFGTACTSTVQRTPVTLKFIK